MSAEHESFIKTPKQLVTVVILSFVLPVVIIALIVTWVGSFKRPGAGADTMSEASTLARIKPVAGFQLGQPAPGSAEATRRPAPVVVASAAPAEPRTGEAVYNTACMACHASGAAGAPKLGDNGAWAPRIAQGYEALLASALNGKGAMPPQGGGQFSNTEIGRAVVHMVNQSGGDLAMPQ